MIYPLPRRPRTIARGRPGRRAAACSSARALLERAGGMTVIRDAVIDDCALAAAARPPAGGSGSATTPESPRHAGIRRSVRSGTWSREAPTRSSRRSPLVVAGCVLGLGYVFVVPVVALVAGSSIRAPRGRRRLRGDGADLPADGALARMCPGLGARAAAFGRPLHCHDGVVGVAASPRPRRRVEGASLRRDRGVGSDHAGGAEPLELGGVHAEPIRRRRRRCRRRGRDRGDGSCPGRRRTARPS